MIKKLNFCFFLLLILNPHIASSKLGTSKFIEMVLVSDVILKAKAVESISSSYPKHKGGMRFDVISVLKGDYQETTIDITWDSEVHQQRVRNTGDTYYLYLQKDLVDDEYFASHYGRSYLKVNEQQEIVWKYPTSMLRLEGYNNLLVSCLNTKKRKCLSEQNLVRITKEIIKKACPFSNLQFKNFELAFSIIRQGYFLGDDAYFFFGKIQNERNKQSMKIFSCKNNQLTHIESFEFKGKKIYGLFRTPELRVYGDNFGVNIECKPNDKKRIVCKKNEKN